MLLFQDARNLLPALHSLGDGIVVQGHLSGFNEEVEETILSFGI